MAVKDDMKKVLQDIDGIRDTEKLTDNVKGNFWKLVAELQIVAKGVEKGKVDAEEAKENVTKMLDNFNNSLHSQKIPEHEKLNKVVRGFADKLESAQKVAPASEGGMFAGSASDEKAKAETHSDSPRPKQ